MNETVSVVMGTFNGERHIEEQLLSIVNQSLKPVEIIISDDGSTDSTVDIARAIAAKSAVPIHVSQNPTRLGFAENFLDAASRAVGSYIAFSDQDDRWYSNKLESSLRAMRLNDAVYCSHAVDLMDERGQDLRVVAQQADHDLVIPPFSADPWAVHYGFSVTVRASLLQTMPSSQRGLDTFTPGQSLSHDRWAYTLAWSTGRSVHLHQPLAAYRQHAQQLYGGPVRRGLGTKVRSKLHNEADVVALRASVSALRAMQFDAAGVNHRRAASQWRRIADIYALRNALYRSEQSTTRLRLLVQLSKLGAYSSPPEPGTGRMRLLEDLVLGIPGPRLRAAAVAPRAR